MLVAKLKQSQVQGTWIKKSKGPVAGLMWGATCKNWSCSLSKMHREHAKNQLRNETITPAEKEKITGGIGAGRWYKSMI